MKKALLIASILFVAVVSTACINNIAVQELNNKASEFMQKGDYESAMNRLQASLDLDNTMYQTYYNLGVAAINANKYDVAISALEDGIKINPDFHDFYYSLGVAQIGFADKIYESLELKETAKFDTEKEEVELTTNIENVDKADMIELKKSAIQNLNKYLELEPTTKDKQSIDEMIKQCNEFIAESENKSEKKEVVAE